MNTISRRTFAGSLASGAAVSLSAAPRRPNIIFLCADQHSGLALGAAGHPIVRTPNLDRLAARGMLFRNAYCGSPVCVPGRASLMTGQFASDVGSYCNSTPFDGRTPSWGNRLRDAGYHCWATGKLDLTLGKDYGFEEVETAHGHSQHPDITSLFRAPVCFRANERQAVNGVFKDHSEKDNDVASRTLDFLRDRAPKLGKPWVAYAGFHLPHPNWVAQEKYRALYPPETMPLPAWPDGYLERRPAMFQILANFKNISTPIPADRVRRARAAYYSCISELDAIAGRILDEVDKSGQWDNTVIVYTSDHGEMLGEHGLWLKNVLLEGAARVPLILAGASLPKGKIVETPVMHADLIATLIDLAGAKKGPELRGQSLLGDRRSGIVYAESHSEGNCTGSFIIRKGEWKYFYFTGDAPLLFNLKDDAGEMRNLAGVAAHTGIRRELHAHLTSLLDPDAVTWRAFSKQDEVLKAMVARLSPDQFYGELKGRLGPTQARVQTHRLYGRITK
ncbi:MAG: sulfatase-like hydrolase/transferase [Bryobacteraceae bacterium]